MKINVEFNNITKAQAIALEDMFAEMVRLGKIGSSRWLNFLSDGDGNFRPEILINNKEVSKNNIFPKEHFWDKDVYKMDYDAIAWQIED